jgi:hypothetical protein
MKSDIVDVLNIERTTNSYNPPPHCFMGVRQKKDKKNPPEWTGGFRETISGFIMLSNLFSFFC